MVRYNDIDILGIAGCRVWPGADNIIGIFEEFNRYLVRDGTGSVGLGPSENIVTEIIDCNLGIRVGRIGEGGSRIRAADITPAAHTGIYIGCSKVGMRSSVECSAERIAGCIDVGPRRS